MKGLASFLALTAIIMFLGLQLFAEVQISSRPVNPEFAALTSDLVKQIPPRLPRALTGSQFIRKVRYMDSRQRERAVLGELTEGNIPSFLRRLVPVKFTHTWEDRTQTVTIFVMPDYLAIGSDDDFLRIPMNLETANAIAVKFGFILPTTHIVDEIYAQSDYHFVPEPLPAGPRMRSTEYFQRHNKIIEAQGFKGGVVPGMLVSGHKKDLVLTNRLAEIPGRIAIYGWHRLDGSPIQPLSIIHGVCYEDYSHGIRLVSEMAWENGKVRSLRDIMQDPIEAVVISDEGPIHRVFSGDTCHSVSRHARHFKGPQG